LALHFLEHPCREFGRGCPKLTRSQVDILRRYDWPGNIRELKNVIERAVILSQGETLRLDLSLPEATVEPSDESEPTLATQSDRVFVTDAEVRKQQRDNMLAALEHADWRISGRGGAADLLGLKPSTLTDRLRAFGIERHRDAGNAATQP
jgi:DNA-binding NtrC family response regulator